jgi:hypothetical protein
MASLHVESDILFEATGCTWDTIDWGTMYRLIRGSIYWFCYFMNFRPTPQQQELIDDIEDGVLREAVKSGQGPGKTTCSAIIGMWWGIRVIDTQVLVTAPSMKLCRDVYLKECRRRLVRAHPFLRKFIEVTKSRVYFGGPNHPNWQIIPVTASATDAVGAQGQHDDNMHIIFEEASGISPTIWETMEGTASNTESEYTPDANQCCILAIGNPNEVGTPFYDCFHTERGDGKTHGWKCLTFNAEESPIVSQENIERLARKYGRDSNIFRVRVLGQFPKMADFGIISMDDLEAAARMRPDEALLKLDGRKQVGIDVARQGGDEMVVIFRQGGCMLFMERWTRVPGFEPADAIRWAFAQQLELGWEDKDVLYVVDASGMGQGVLHLFRDAGKRYLPFHNHAVPYKPKTYKNKLTEGWFGVAKYLREQKISIPDDSLMMAQLADRQYKMDNKGLIQVETKDDYKKRTERRSPDRGEAFVMAFYGKSQASGRVSRKKTRSPRVGPGKVIYSR